MSELFSERTFIYVVVFLLPGFIARWVWSSIVVGREENEKTAVLASLVSSAWLYAVLSPTIYWAIWRAHGYDAWPKRFAVSLFCVIFVWPIVAALIVAALRTTSLWRWFANKLDIRSPEPRAWDTFFARREGCFIRVTFDDGAMIGGLYYGPDSAASVYPADEDLLIEVLYRLDKAGNFIGPIEGSKGGWIDMESVRHLEFLSIEKKEKADAGEQGKAGLDVPAIGSQEEPSADAVGAGQAGPGAHQTSTVGSSGGTASEKGSVKQ